MNKRKSIQTRMGSIIYTFLGIRHSSMKSFLHDFEIDIRPYCKTLDVEFKNLRLSPNFVFFLLENKQFIKFYNQDYYGNKSIEIIAHVSGRKTVEIENYFKAKNYQVDVKYPYRYISSFAIDYRLNKESTKYAFLRYDDKNRYEGCSEYRRANYIE